MNVIYDVDFLQICVKLWQLETFMTGSLMREHFFRKVPCSKYKLTIYKLNWTTGHLLENVRATTSHNPIGLHGLLQGQLHICIQDYTQSSDLNLNISQLYRPSRPVTGIALLYGDGVCFL
jgi:hypothetical protein